jgi:hypothetical protein
MGEPTILGFTTSAGIVWPTMAAAKKKSVKKKPAKKSGATKRALNKTIASLRKEAAVLEAFVETLDLVAEVPITRKKVVKKRAVKKVVKKKAVKKKAVKKKK